MEPICLEGWAGVNCIDRDISSDNGDPECPDGFQRMGCRNGGTCFDGTCCCPNGYEGLVCQTETLECMSAPCGSAGTCLDQIGSYYCLCADGEWGFYGDGLKITFFLCNKIM